MLAGGDSSDEDSDMIGPSVTEMSKKEPSLLVRDDTIRKDAPVREWDKEKKGIDTVKCLIYLTVRVKHNTMAQYLIMILVNG